VGPATRARVDPDRWRLTPPTAESQDSLVVAFYDPLDIALLRRCLAVVDEARAPVYGTAAVDEGECVWRFEPGSPWRAGHYELRVDGRLEDPAGNSVRRVFDRDLSLPEHEPLDADFVTVPFSIT
jgi:hypothetical protein